MYFLVRIKKLFILMPNKSVLKYFKNITKIDNSVIIEMR